MNTRSPFGSEDLGGLEDFLRMLAQAADSDESQSGVPFEVRMAIAQLPKGLNEFEVPIFPELGEDALTGHLRTIAREDYARKGIPLSFVDKFHVVVHKDDETTAIYNGIPKGIAPEGTRDDGDDLKRRVLSDVMGRSPFGSRGFGRSPFEDDDDLDGLPEPLRTLLSGGRGRRSPFGMPGRGSLDPMEALKSALTRRIMGEAFGESDEDDGLFGSPRRGSRTSSQQNNRNGKDSYHGIPAALLDSMLDEGVDQCPNPLCPDRRNCTVTRALQERKADRNGNSQPQYVGLTQAEAERAVRDALLSIYRREIEPNLEPIKDFANAYKRAKRTTLATVALVTSPFRWLHRQAVRFDRYNRELAFRFELWRDIKLSDFPSEMWEAFTDSEFQEQLAEASDHSIRRSYALPVIWTGRALHGIRQFFGNILDNGAEMFEAFSDPYRGEYVLSDPIIDPKSVELSARFGRYLRRDFAQAVQGLINRFATLIGAETRELEVPEPRRHYGCGCGG